MKLLTRSALLEPVPVKVERAHESDKMDLFGEFRQSSDAELASPSIPEVLEVVDGVPPLVDSGVGAASTLASRIAAVRTMPEKGCPVGLWPNPWIESPEPFGEVLDDSGASGVESGGIPAPERIPLPDGLTGPCSQPGPCAEIGWNCLFWENRFGKVFCVGCTEKPPLVFFKRFLRLCGGPGWRTAPASSLWLEECELSKNPWRKRPAAVAAEPGSATAPWEDY